MPISHLPEAGKCWFAVPGRRIQHRGCTLWVSLGESLRLFLWPNLKFETARARGALRLLSFSIPTSVAVPTSFSLDLPSIAQAQIQMAALFLERVQELLCPSRKLVVPAASWWIT